MIGYSSLLIGLLLIATYIISARVPGPAAFAGPGTVASDGGRQTGGRRGQNWVRAFVLSPVHPRTWAAGVAIGIGFLAATFAFSTVASLLSAGASTLVAGIGIVFVAVAIEGARLFARFERWRAQLAGSRRLRAHTYRPLSGSIWDILRAEYADENRWRDILYVGVSFPLAILEFVVVLVLWLLALFFVTSPFWYAGAPGSSPPPLLGWLVGSDSAAALVRLAVGLLLLPVAASASQLVMALHRPVVAGLLCASDDRDLQRQVEQLRESRSAVLAAEASELRRIERDLHDGAQQRLVMLSMDLGQASEKFDSDPEAARQLVVEGREQAQQALAELRSLVRGIAPGILLDRGLVAAIFSLASHSAVPVTVHSELAPGLRLPDGVERAAYYVVTEALANVAKHSHATRCEIRCRRAGPALVLEIEDNGAGGAVIVAGGGLAGLVHRVDSLDGSLKVESPNGGPTTLRAEFPVPGWS